MRNKHDESTAHWLGRHAAMIGAAHIAQNAASKAILNSDYSSALYRKAYAAGRQGHANLSTGDALSLGLVSAISPEIGIAADASNKYGQWTKANPIKGFLSRRGINILSPKAELPDSTIRATIQKSHLGQIARTLTEPLSAYEKIEAKYHRGHPSGARARVVGEVVGNLGLVGAKLPDVAAYNTVKRLWGSQTAKSIPGMKGAQEWITKKTMIDPLKRMARGSEPEGLAAKFVNHYIFNPFYGDAIDIGNAIGSSEHLAAKLLRKRI